MNDHLEPLLMRYFAMAGTAPAATAEAAARAEADRKAYGKYLPAADRPYAVAAFIVRWLFEVCDVPFGQARERVIGLIKGNGMYRLDPPVSVSVVAASFLNDNKSVFAADHAVWLYVEAAKGTEWEFYWRRMQDTLRFGKPDYVEVSESDPTLH